MRPTTAVADVLEQARDVTQPLMRDAVARLVPSIRDVVSYHLGWTDVAGNPTAVKGGKGIRTALATLSAEASWADASVGAPGGVAVELVHNFSLLHDDLMDGDVERRHRPTAWSLWGLASPSWPATHYRRWPRTSCSAARTRPPRPPPWRYVRRRPK